MRRWHSFPFFNLIFLVFSSEILLPFWRNSYLIKFLKTNKSFKEADKRTYSVTLLSF